VELRARSHRSRPSPAATRGGPARKASAECAAANWLYRLAGKGAVKGAEIDFCIQGEPHPIVQIENGLGLTELHSWFRSMRRTAHFSPGAAARPCTDGTRGPGNANR